MERGRRKQLTGKSLSHLENDQDEEDIMSWATKIISKQNSSLPQKKEKQSILNYDAGTNKSCLFKYIFNSRRFGWN